MKCSAFIAGFKTVYEGCVFMDCTRFEVIAVVLLKVQIFNEYLSAIMVTYYTANSFFSRFPFSMSCEYCL